MKIDEINGFVIWESDGWGKAVKGTKKTTTIQVRRFLPASGGYMQLAQFQYLIGNFEKREAAIQKARDYIKNYKKL